MSHTHFICIITHTKIRISSYIVFYLYVFIFCLKTTNPIPDNNFCLKLCKFEGNLLEVISFGN